MDRWPFRRRKRPMFGVWDVFDPSCTVCGGDAQPTPYPVWTLECGPVVPILRAHTRYDGAHYWLVFQSGLRPVAPGSRAVLYRVDLWSENAGGYRPLVVVGDHADLPETVALARAIQRDLAVYLMESLL